MKTPSLILTLLICYSFSLTAQTTLPPAVPYTMIKDFDILQLPPIQWIIEEGQSKLSAEEVAQHQLKDAQILDLTANPTFTIKAHRNYWLRVQVQSQLPLSPFALQLDRVGNCFPWEFTYYLVEAYVQKEETWQQVGLSGTAVESSKRDIPNKLDPSLIKIDPDHASFDYWIRLSMAESCDMKVVLSLVKLERIEAPRPWTFLNVSHVLLTGAIILLVLLALLLFFWTRDVLYIWFLLFQIIILVATLFQQTLNEVFYTFFRENPRIFVILKTVIDLIRFLAIVQFGLVYIDTKTKFPHVHRAFLASMIGLIILTVLGISMRIFPQYSSNSLFAIRPVIAFISLFIGLISFIYLIFSKDRLARFFCIGAVIPYVVTMIAMFFLLRKGAQNYPISSLIHGLGILLALTLALAYRFRVITMGRLQLQSELIVEQQEAKRLKELDAFKSLLYTNITHEFRTPLTIILGMAEQLKNSTKKNAEQSIQLIERNGRQLLDLINQLLDLSKLENNSFQLQYQQGDIVPFMRYLTESYHSFTNVKNISLRFHSTVESLVMDYDAKQIQQLWHNFLSNAVKFTPSGGMITIKLSLKDTPKKAAANGTRQLLIKFKDTGIGIAENDLPHIFDRFFQADNENTRQGEGTGIGLAHCRELVKLMGGNIKVQSVINKGTTFTVQLPVTNKAVQEDVNFEENNIPLASPFRESEKEKTNRQDTDLELPQLLIIEDNADIVTYLQACLEDQYQIDVAYNGKIGIEKALENIPDLIISDVMMPEKNGFEVCHTLKNEERTSHIPIVILTAKSDVASKIEGLKTGADAYLAKPFNKAELLVRLEKLLELRQKLKARFAQMTIAAPVASEKEEPVDMEDAFIQKVRAIVQEQISNPDFNPIRLSRLVQMSQSQLYRKMKALTDTTPALFIRSIRLHKGMELLQSTDMTVSEIAYEVGFSDPSYFSRTFSEEFGSPPNENRN